MKRIFAIVFAFACLGLGAQDSLGVSKLGQYTYPIGTNDLWGWADSSGREFALVGLDTAFSIVEVTNPSQPVEKHQIGGALSLWRDVKTWKNYAYVVHDNVFSGFPDGLLIVDLSTIDSATISYTNYYPMVMVDTTNYFFQRAHNLYIDENGILYAFGSNAGIGGVLMFDVDANPTSPVYLGAYDSSYYHDGVVRGDTLWGAALLKGRFEVVDISNKSNPQLLASQVTPNAFCHNVWFSDDNKTLFTTDEKTGAYLVSYDVSDLNNITELDRIRTGIFDPTQVIPHNTHVYGDFLVTSYYTSGLQIVDATHPDILVETAYYDTSPLTGDGFHGAWGAYPYLPSKNILVSDIEEGLFILNSNYPRASYFTAFVKDSVTGNPIVNAGIDMISGDINGSTNIFGDFQGGQRDSGVYDVVISKPGYISDTINVTMSPGQTAARTVSLLPLGFNLEEESAADYVKVYPNPSKGNFTVEVANAGSETFRIQAYNTSGIKLIDRDLPMTGGKAEMNHQLAAGIYMFHLVKDGGFSESFRMVVE
jgi:choice-of-anchor B domain-containing protein